MAREIVRHPETGEPSFKTVSINYEKAEIADLEASVETIQAEFDAAVQAETSATDHRKEVESRLNDAKSELENVQNLVENPDGELDAGTDGDGSESEATEPAEEEAAFPQTA